MPAVLKNEETIARVAALEEIYMGIEGKDTYWMEKRISKYRYESANSGTLSGRELNGNLCMMLLEGATWLLENEYGGCFCTLSSALRRGANSRISSPAPSNPDFTYPTEIEAIRETIEQMMAEVQKEAQEEYDYDSSWHTEHNQPSPHDVHPWGEDTVGVIRAWVHADPFVWFCVIANTKEHAEFNLSDYLIDMATDREDGTSLGESIKEHFNGLMTKFSKNYFEGK